MKSIDLVANNLKVSHSQVENTLKLLNEGATVPFIARYRKNVTGNLNEEIIEKIFEQFKYNEELNKRKEAIIKILSESKLLTDELKNAIENTKQKQELENIYEPFKVGKKTKASEAIEKV
ncbi:Tex-like protein N-terminal domain [Chlamydia abortus]|nr:Tex-like protein N-terminal domain [Chlamydia abortus]